VTMNRKEFLVKAGAGAVIALCPACLSGCSPPDIPTAPTNVDMTLNLDDPANAPLKNNGGYIYNNGLIIARLNNGTIVALSAACTHAGVAVAYDPGSNRFHCPAHGSNFATDGSVINGPAGSALVSYHVQVNGTSVHITS
jgi:cytochrome b6-f complex iron-sulfur subunit